MPVLHLIAGPHGAGKSSLYQYLLAPRLPGIPFVNPQAYVATQLSDVKDPQERARMARSWVDEQWQGYLREGKTFVAETAFSHESRIALILQARALGFQVVMYVIAMDEPRRLLARVSQSMREGGLQVPAHKVLERYARCLDHLRQAVVLTSLSMIFDSTEGAESSPRLIATIDQQQLKLHTAVRPRWAEKVLGFAEA